MRSQASPPAGMTMSTKLPVLVLGFALTTCGPGPLVEECIPIVDRVGPGLDFWCDAYTIYDPELEWDGPPPARERFVCLAPDAEGECVRCGLDELAKAVEEPLREQLAVATPDCDLERWEVHCMRTIEQGMSVGGPDTYCCYEIAIWGESCEP